MIKYFPFSPGIPWKMGKKLNYISSSLPKQAWQNAISRANEIVIICLGGVLEAYVSLMYMEMIKRYVPAKKISWYGPEQFYPLIIQQGLAQPIKIELPLNFELKYPTPMFLDTENTLYINSLFNYLKILNLDGEFIYKNNRPLIRQIYSNTTQPWDLSYLPILRNLEISNELDLWIKANKFFFNQPFICIFPDKENNLSQHTLSCLNWTINEIKCLNTILKQSGIKLVIFTNQPGKFYGDSFYLLPTKLEFITHFLTRTKAVVSESIDFILISYLMNQTPMIGYNYRSPYDFLANQKFTELKESKIFTDDINYIRVANLIKGL
jgi:hypothetical protein